jgi:hypothetical protein
MTDKELQDILDAIELASKELNELIKRMDEREAKNGI